jgi:hypothetical protein
MDDQVKIKDSLRNLGTTAQRPWPKGPGEFKQFYHSLDCFLKFSNVEEEQK